MRVTLYSVIKDRPCYIYAYNQLQTDSTFKVSTCSLIYKFQIWISSHSNVRYRWMLDDCKCIGFLCG